MDTHAEVCQSFSAVTGCAASSPKTTGPRAGISRRPQSGAVFPTEAGPIDAVVNIAAGEGVATKRHGNDHDKKETTTTKGETWPAGGGGGVSFPTI